MIRRPPSATLVRSSAASDVDKRQPHGCVSWNYRHILGVWGRPTSHPHGCVSWNSIDFIPCAINRSHPHGCVSWNVKELKQHFCSYVTPSRVCELKSFMDFSFFRADCHTLTGVWVEIFMLVSSLNFRVCHTLTGVWVEIDPVRAFMLRGFVTPSRVCELKSSV